jgi:Transposase
MILVIAADGVRAKAHSRELRSHQRPLLLWPVSLALLQPGLISLVERRRRWSIEEKLAILVEALASGASVSAVADRHGVARGLLYTCLRLTREGRM